MEVKDKIQEGTASETVPYAEFFLRGIASLIEALVFMALSIPVAFTLPMFLDRLNATTLVPQIPGFFFLEGFLPGVTFPLFLASVFHHLNVSQPEGVSASATMVWTMVLGGLLLVDLLYHAIMESSPLQGTIGKIIVGMKVQRVDGKRASFITCLLRNCLRLLSMATLFLGYFMVLKNSRKQALHDKLSGCVIVNDTPPQ